MLKNLLNKKRQEGFSIVEVMIVLAIAGLIILVVFLAVPALQRNSRNTSMKADVGNVAAAISEFQGANQGKSPTAIAVADGTITVSGATGTTPVTSSVQGGTVVNSSTTTANTTTAGTITVVFARKCNGGALGGASARSVAVTYVVETTSGVAAQCTDA